MTGLARLAQYLDIGDFALSLLAANEEATASRQVTKGRILFLRPIREEVEVGLVTLKKHIMERGGDDRIVFRAAAARLDREVGLLSHANQRVKVGENFMRIIARRRRRRREVAVVVEIEPLCREGDGVKRRGAFVGRALEAERPTGKNGLHGAHAGAGNSCLMIVVVAVGWM